jgi:hypothetical protein
MLGSRLAVHLNREVIVNQRLTTIIMHIDEKAILFSLAGPTYRARAVVMGASLDYG